MIDELLKNYRIKNTLAIVFVLLVLISSFTISYINYQSNKNILYHDIDQKLKTVALSTKFILGDDFFDKAIESDSISEEEDKQNILKLSKFINNLDVEYVYTMIKKDDKIYFTSSSAKDDELKTDNMTKYFDKYDEATKLLLNISEKKQIAYEESTDKWGSFRTVFISDKTKNGQSYIIGADIKIDLIKEKLNQFVTNIILVQSIILLVLLVFAFYFIKISKQELKDIKLINDKLDNEIKEKTLELSTINNSLEKMVKDEVSKNRQKDKQLIKQSKFVQMGETISMIAHQWRQPLNTISASVNLIILHMKMGSFDEEKLEDTIPSISENVQYLSTTIDNFIDFFRPQEEMKVSNFETIVDKALSLNKYILDNNKIEVVVNKINIEDFLTYENELVQVLLNIFKNAKDALKEKDIQDAKLIISIDNNKINIEDNAGGIDEDIINKIFDPYFSTKGKNGTGLGLYMSKVIIEEHCQGELYVANTDNGARFTITIPTKANL